MTASQATPISTFPRDTGPCGRFAPSPSGRLHFGSLVAALGSWLRARSQGMPWRVRIEDLDRPRVVAGAADDILATLAAFGLHADGEVLYQSRRIALYEAALDQLREAGIAYPCHCSRSDLTAFGGIHPAQCPVRASRSGAPAWRVRVGTAKVTFDDAVYGRISQALADAVGDFVVRRADGTFSYQLAVVVDDAAQGVGEVVRGADLLDSTPRQIFLQSRLGLPTPAYLHLPLVLGDDGRKLSKHERSLAVDSANPLPALRAALNFLGQAIPPHADAGTLLQAALAAFDPARIPVIAPVDAALQEE